jgi:alpha-glucosidase
MRSLAIDYTFDRNIYDTQFENQYLFGSAFMVAPFEGDAKFGKVYFPQGNWYDLYNGRMQSGNQSKIIEVSMHKLPVFVKESSIFPMQSLVQTTAEKPTDTLDIHVYKGVINNRFVYYEDDGESYAYENGAFYKRAITYDPAKNTIVFEKVSGSLASKFNNIKLILHGFNDLSSIKINGSQTALSDDFNSFLVPISKFDPQGNSNAAETERVKSTVLKNDSNTFTINY